MRGEITKIR